MINSVEKFEHGYALLIGVGDTTEPKWSLPVTVKDVRAIHKVLTDPNLCAYPDDDKHIRMLCNADATRQAILDGLAWLKEQAENDPNATIAVYYSGHGCLSAFTGQYYLIPHETQSMNIQNSALSANDFTAALRTITAKRLLVFIDSCHAEGMAAAKDGSDLGIPNDFVKMALHEGIINSLKQGEGRVVSTSSRGQQSSYIRPDGIMSIYTYHLIEALQGASNRPGETVVRVSNLMSYLYEAVPKSAHDFWEAEQIPFIEMAAEDFPVAMLRGGKGIKKDDSMLNPLGYASEEKPTDVKVTQIGKYNVNVGGNATGFNIGDTIHSGDKDKA